MSKSQVLRQQKRKNRERRIRHDANIRRNAPACKYRLDVCLDDSWHVGVMTFRTWDSVLVYKNDIEDKRSKGAGIIAGRIVCLKTGKIEMVIEHSPMKPMKGALPDTLAGNPYVAQKAMLDNRPKNPYSV